MSRGGLNSLLKKYLIVNILALGLNSIYSDSAFAQEEEVVDQQAWIDLTPHFDLNTACTCLTCSAIAVRPRGMILSDCLFGLRFDTAGFNWRAGIVGCPGSMDALLSG